MPDFFGNLIDQILGFARAHEQWLPAIGFAFAFVKSLPLVALFVPGTALLLSIGAVLGSGAGQFAPVWLAIAIGAALGDWVAYALGVKVGPALLQWAPLRRRPRQVLRAAAFIKRWGVLSIVLCRFFGPLRATVPTLAGIFEMRRGRSRPPTGPRRSCGRRRCWRRAGRAWAGSWVASAGPWMAIPFRLRRRRQRAPASASSQSRSRASGGAPSCAFSVHRLKAAPLSTKPSGAARRPRCSSASISTAGAMATPRPAAAASSMC